MTKEFIKPQPSDVGSVFAAEDDKLWLIYDFKETQTRTANTGPVTKTETWATRWPGPPPPPHGVARRVHTSNLKLVRKVGTQGNLAALLNPQKPAAEKVTELYGFKKGDWVGSFRCGSPYQITKIKCTNEWDVTHRRTAATGFVHLQHPDHAASLVQTFDEFLQADWLPVDSSEPNTGWINIYTDWHGKVVTGHASSIYDTKEQARAAARTDYGRFPPSYKDTIKINWAASAAEIATAKKD